MTRIQELKHPLRMYYRQFDDEILCRVLAHAPQLNYASCCCWIGAATATLPFSTYGSTHRDGHLQFARGLPWGEQAEQAAMDLGWVKCHNTYGNDLRRLRIIPILKTILRVRERERRLARDIETTLVEA